MKREIEINERIEAYLNGELPIGEAEEFRAMLAGDPALDREVELHRNLRDIITDGAYLRVKNELHGIHARKLRTINRIKRSAGFGLGGLILGIIAFLLLWDNQGTRTGMKNRDSVLIPYRDSVTITVPSRYKPEMIPGPTPVTIRDSSSRIGQLTEPEKGRQNPDTAHLAGREKRQIEPEPREKDAAGPEKTVSEIRSDLPSQEAASEGPGKTDCRKVVIAGNFNESESCNNKPTGLIVINRNSVTGGVAPYSFSLSQDNFRDTMQFGGLYPGNYTLYARDANNCVNRLGIAVIRSVDCTYQAVFAPDKGETWTVPVDPDRQGTLKIFSKAGMLVYSAKVTGDQVTTWAGTTISGQSLPMGLYPFEITYGDGTGFSGTVTIVR
jgi:hypothetical protein